MDATPPFSVEEFLAEEEGWNHLNLEENGLFLIMWRLATRAHKGQRRRNGAKVVTHEAATARSIKNDGLDIRTILSGMGHDVIEETAVDAKEIIEKLGRVHGPIVAFMITAVSRPKGKEKASPIDYFDQIALATEICWQIIVMKAHDRREVLREEYAGSIKKETVMLLETLGPFAETCQRSRRLIPASYLPKFDKLVDEIMQIATERLAEIELQLAA